MEKPYQGRSVITETLRGTQIRIPKERNWFIICFMGFWLLAWSAGIVFSTGIGLGIAFSGDASGGVPTLIFSGIGIVAGLFVVRAFIWLLIGEEVITLEAGSLSIKNKGDFFSKIKTYDLNEVKKVRIQEIEIPNWGFGQSTSVQTINTNTTGTIRFDYGMKTIKFGDKLHEAEARKILDHLKEKQFLNDKNFI